MATFVTLFNWTEQGVRNSAETVSRADAFAKAAEKAGAKVQSIFWTIGRYDGVCILEAPDAQSAAAILLKLGGLGNLRTETLQAFTADEMKGVLAKAK